VSTNVLLRYATFRGRKAATRGRGGSLKDALAKARATGSPRVLFNLRVPWLPDRRGAACYIRLAGENNLEKGP
jgi:hypothetical protein